MPPIKNATASAIIRIQPKAFKNCFVFLRFSFSIVFDGSMLNNGISLNSLLKISDSLNTELLFVSGDGHDYQISELTSSHDTEVILNIHFIGNKSKLLNDYKNWYIQRYEILSKKINKRLQR